MGSKIISWKIIVVIIIFMKRNPRGSHREKDQKMYGGTKVAHGWGRVPLSALFTCERVQFSSASSFPLSRTKETNALGFHHRMPPQLRYLFHLFPPFALIFLSFLPSFLLLRSIWFGEPAESSFHARIRDTSTQLGQENERSETKPFARSTYSIPTNKKTRP